MLEFGFLWALVFLPIPAIVRWILPAKPNSEQSIYSSSFHLLSQLNHIKVSDHSNGITWRLALLWLIWLLLVIAAARPQWLGEARELPTQARNIILAVDISGSMAEQDMGGVGSRKDRLTIVKEIISEFVKKRSSDRVGLTLFGSQAYTHVPLTFDHSTLNTLLQEASVGIAGKYTAIGDALGLSIQALYNANTEQHQGIIILLTDGHNNSGTTKPLEIASLAKDMNIKIHTVGIGAKKDNSVTGFFFSRNPSADLDEETLQKISNTTGGRFFRATDGSRLRNIYKLIDELEPIETTDNKYKPINALYYIPLLAALIAITILIASYFWRYKKRVQADNIKQ